MQLLADRFALFGDGKTAFDLATGERVALTVAAAGGESEQRRWALACDEAERCRHPAVPWLVDYGMVGGSQRFEARRILPAGAAPAPDPHTPGIVIVPRPAVAAIGEMFEPPQGVRPRFITLWGPHGAGKHTVVGDLARCARLRGFVPVAAHVLDEFAEPLRGRSLFVIDDDDRRAGWIAWLVASLSASRPHVLLFVRLDEPSLAHGVAVGPVPGDVLVRAVRPAGSPAAPFPTALIQRFAEQSHGWPGRFARLVWRQPRSTHSDRRSSNVPRLDFGGTFSGALGPADAARVARASVVEAAKKGAWGWPDGRSGWGEEGALVQRIVGDPRSTKTRDRRLSTGTLRAAEQPAVYGNGGECASTGPRRGGSWPLPDDLASWRDRIDFGAKLAVAGRHAQAERVLRQAIGALARRGESAQAGEGSITLATLLIRRGRPHDAHTTLAMAADFWRKAGDEARLIDVAVLTATASIELARLDQAETAATAAVASARSRADQPRTGRALGVLARTLFWRARYGEADATLKSMFGGGNSDAEGMEAGGLDVAIAVGLGDLRLAVSRATEALAGAQQVADAQLVAQAGRRAAFAHLAVCDLAAVERDVAVSVAAARICREPLIAARSRLILAEALRRSGKPSAALGVLRRVFRSGSTQLPPIIRARCELLRDLLLPRADADAIVRRHVSASGLGGLALYGTTPRTARPGMHDPMVAAIVDILDLCQSSDDERTVLTEVCRRVRGQLHAVGTAFVVEEDGVRSGMVADGGRIDMSIAGRAMAAGVTVAPHRCGDRLEAAAPIRSGGAVIGALVARWTLGTPHELGSAAALMTTVAAAIGPSMSVVMARARRLSVPSMSELIGTSAAMAEVRRGVERAALAPFAVLIEGESGCGKELVARALHRSGPRRTRALCTLNCAALPEDLVEAELFGHVRGAFTGAVGERTGVFEEAHGGTLLLDEIGELSPRAQAKVLRVIQDGELRRVGDNSSRRIDVRIVSATNRDLRQEVAAGRFRLDLLYRLDVVRIVVPPLRERREDIPVLAEHFWGEATARMGSRATLAPATLAALGRYGWPGNVRELQNTLASLAVRTAKRGVVPPAALGPQFTDDRLADALRLEDARRTFEERFVRAALVRAGGHRARAAADLGVTRQGLTKLMSRLGIT